MPQLADGGSSPVLSGGEAVAGGGGDGAKKLSPSLAPVHDKVKRFEAAMDKPDSAGALRQSKSVFSTGFYGYAVLDYANMSKKAEEQVRGLESSMQQLQADFSQCQAKLHATAAELSASRQREAAAVMTIQTQAQDISRLQEELGAAQAWLTKEAVRICHAGEAIFGAKTSDAGVRASVPALGKQSLDVMVDEGELAAAKAVVTERLESAEATTALAVDHGALQAAVEVLLSQTCDMMAAHDEAVALAKEETERVRGEMDAVISALHADAGEQAERLEGVREELRSATDEVAELQDVRVELDDARDQLLLQRSEAEDAMRAALDESAAAASEAEAVTEALRQTVEQLTAEVRAPFTQRCSLRWCSRVCAQ